MRKKWKYGKSSLCGRIAAAFQVLLGVVLALSIFSCRHQENPKHSPGGNRKDLDGLVQPANQTVFSSVNAIVPTVRTLSPFIQATGVIVYDPQLINTISSRYNGRIEKLYVRYNFENVVKGQRLMDVYSPELLTEQKNFLFLHGSIQPDENLLKASRLKLQLLGMTSDQIMQLEASGKVLDPLPVFSPYSGHIHDLGLSAGAGSQASATAGMSTGMSTQQAAPMQIENLPSSNTSALTFKEGMYVQEGQELFAVYKTDRVWAVLNIYPRDAARIKVGDPVSITLETNPGNVITSEIRYIEPVTAQGGSTIKARVYLENKDDQHIKIGTLLSASVLSKKISGIWLPRAAVVNMGHQQVVFIKAGNHFITRGIQTGLVTDSIVEIRSGLSASDSVAANAQFMVDSESFIETSANEK